jgi:toxin ParE1/3/4
VRVIYAAGALADIAEIYGYISPLNPDAAIRQIAAIRRGADGLDLFPHRGRMRPDGSRELLSVRPYVIVYDISDVAVSILRIWHGAQDRQ